MFQWNTLLYHWYNIASPLLATRQDPMPSRSRLLALGAVSAAAVLLAAGPASAAPIADGTIFTTGWYGGQLYTADSSTGALTTVGASSGTNWISGLDFDGTTGVGYAVTYLTDPVIEDGPYGDAQLFTIDPVTGLTTLVGTVTRNGEPVANCLDLDYTGGVILIACDYDATESWIGAVDPVTAAATQIVPSIDRTQAIARNGSTLIAFGFEGVVNSVDLTDGTVTPLGVLSTPGLYPTGADFDAAGALFVASAGSMEPYSLWSFDVASLTGELIGPMGLDGEDVGSGNDISVTGTVGGSVPTATLPDTGFDTAPIALGALLALLAGGALLLSSRRVRSARS